MKESNPDLWNEYTSIVNQVIDWLDERSEPDLTVESIASERDVSPEHLHQMFMEVTGEGLQQHINKNRIQKAAHHLLYARSLTISEIAYVCGFSSPSDFSKDFKQEMGKEPERFREQHECRANEMEESCQLRISVRDFPTKKIYYLRHFGQQHYANPGADVYQSFIFLNQLATRRGLWTSGASLLGIPRYSLMNLPSLQIGYDVCLTSSRSIEVTGAIGSRMLQGGKYAVLHLEEPHEAIAPLLQQLLTNWLPKSGYSYAWRPTMFIFHNNPSLDPQGKWVIDVCLPIE